MRKQRPVKQPERIEEKPELPKEKVELQPAREQTNLNHGFKVVPVVHQPSIEKAPLPKKLSQEAKKESKKDKDCNLI